MIGYSANALRRMRERGVSKIEVEDALLRSYEVRDTSYGRKVACGGPGAGMKHTVAVFELSAQDFKVVTCLKVDREGLERYGFTGI